MEDKKEYIAIWESYESFFEPYSDAEVGRLVRAMMKYKWSGAVPKFNGNERFVWPAIKRDIDAAAERIANKAKTNSQNGAKGGRPKKADASGENPENPNLFEETPKSERFSEKPKEAIEKEREMEKEKESSSSLPPPPEAGTQAEGGTIAPYPEETLVLCAYFEENCHIMRSIPLLNAITNSLNDGATPELVRAVIEDAALANADKPAWYVTRLLEILQREKVRDLSTYQARSETHRNKRNGKNKQYNYDSAEGSF